LSISTKKDDVIRDLEVSDDVLDLLFFERDNQAQIRPCGSRADFAFSVAGQLDRIRASGVKKVERVFFKPCRPNVKGPIRFMRLHGAGLCGLRELGLSGRETGLKPRNAGAGLLGPRKAF